MSLSDAINIQMIPTLSMYDVSEVPRSTEDGETQRQTEDGTLRETEGE